MGTQSRPVINSPESIVSSYIPCLNRDWMKVLVTKNLSLCNSVSYNWVPSLVALTANGNAWVPPWTSQIRNWVFRGRPLLYFKVSSCHSESPKVCSRVTCTSLRRKEDTCRLSWVFLLYFIFKSYGLLLPNDINTFNGVAWFTHYL